MKDDFITRTVGWWELRRKVGIDDGKVRVEDGKVGVENGKVGVEDGNEWWEWKEGGNR